MARYVKPREAADYFGVCLHTLRRWELGEVGGGLDFKRPKFLALLERVRAGDIGTIVVAHRDRLCRFGFEFVEWYCRQYGCEILVLDDDHLSPQQELVEDILTILHCFSSRLYGLRKYRAAIEKDTDLSGAGAG
jgi:putative resolvase